MNVHTGAGGGTIAIEKDVEVPMRDGARLMADVFRPQGTERVPALLNLRSLSEGQAVGHARHAGGNWMTLSVAVICSTQAAVAGGRSVR